MPYFEHNAKKIYYEETGVGFPTVFLHGNTASSKMFTNIIPLFSSNFHKNNLSGSLPLLLSYDSPTDTVRLPDSF